MSCEKRIEGFLTVIEKVANREYIKDNWRSILDKIACLFESDVAAIGEVKDDYVYYTRVSGSIYEVIPWYNPEDFKIHMKDSLYKEFEVREVVKVDNYPSFCKTGNLWKSIGLRHMLVGTLKDTKMFGCLSVMRFSDPKPFTEEDMRIMRSLAFILTSIIREDIERKMLIERAIRDHLTKLYNRYFFEEEVTKELEKARRYGYSISIILFDLDNFKKINDTYGHVVGDEVLKRFADILMKNTRSTDIAVRYGGEEFILVLPYTSSEDARKVAERIKESFKREVFEAGKDRFSLTVSAGVVCCDEGKCSLEELINRVDKAMYEAKKGGKDKVIVYKHSHSVCG